MVRTLFLGLTLLTTTASVLSAGPRVSVRVNVPGVQYCVSYRVRPTEEYRHYQTFADSQAADRAASSLLAQGYAIRIHTVSGQAQGGTMSATPRTTPKTGGANQPRPPAPPVPAPNVQPRPTVPAPPSLAGKWRVNFKGFDNEHFIYTFSQGGTVQIDLPGTSSWHGYYSFTTRDQVLRNTFPKQEKDGRRVQLSGEGRFQWLNANQGIWETKTGFTLIFNRLN